MWLALAVAALVAAASRGDRGLVELGIVVLLVTITATVAVTQIVGAIAQYETQWTWIVGPLLAMLVFEEVARRAVQRWRANALVATGAVGLVVVVAVAVPLVRGATSRTGRPLNLYPGVRSPAAVLADAVVAAIPDRHGLVLADIRRSGAEGPALAVGLERRGVRVRLTDLECLTIVSRALCHAAFGPGRVVRPHDHVGAVVTFVTDTASHPVRDVRGRLVATWSPPTARSAAQRGATPRISAYVLVGDGGL